jgi:hypothetical protein
VTNEVTNVSESGGRFVNSVVFVHFG